MAADSRSDKVKSTIDIQQGGVKYVNTNNVGYSVIQVEIKKLVPSNIYNVYCYTEDLFFHKMPFSVVTKTTAQTTCCASISYTTFFSSIPESVNTTASNNKIYSFTLDSLPKINSVVNVVATPTFTDCKYYEEGTELVPSKYIVPNKFKFSNQSTSLSGSFLIKALPGCYKIVSYISEGSYYDNATDFINVLSSKTPPIPPVISLVQFSNDGRFIYVSFDSPTDKASTILLGKISFDCRYYYI